MVLTETIAVKAVELIMNKNTNHTSNKNVDPNRIDGRFSTGIQGMQKLGKGHSTITSKSIHHTRGAKCQGRTTEKDTNHDKHQKNHGPGITNTIDKDLNNLRLNSTFAQDLTIKIFNHEADSNQKYKARETIGSH